jgi:hypothetical protein
MYVFFESIYVMRTLLGVSFVITPTLQWIALPIMRHTLVMLALSSCARDTSSKSSISIGAQFVCSERRLTSVRHTSLVLDRDMRGSNVSRYARSSTPRQVP